MDLPPTPTESKSKSTTTRLSDYFSPKVTKKYLLNTTNCTYRLGRQTNRLIHAPPVSFPVYLALTPLVRLLSLLLLLSSIFRNMLHI